MHCADHCPHSYCICVACVNASTQYELDRSLGSKLLHVLAYVGELI